MVSDRTDFNQTASGQKHEKRGVVIFGYFGQGNLGDESNLNQLVRRLQSRFDGLPITVISGDPAQTAAIYEVVSIHKFNLAALVRSFQGAAWLIGGSGTVFQDRSSLRSLLYYLGIIALAKLCNLKIFLYGQGFGPMNGRIGKTLAQFLLNRVELIAARDKLSLLTLAELGIDRPEIHYTAEPMLLASPLGEEHWRSFWRQFPPATKTRIGIVVQQDTGVPDEEWSAFFQYLLWQGSIELFLVTTDRNDREFALMLGARAGATVLTPAQSWEDLQRSVAGVDLLISTRLHGLVAAVTQNVPCLGISFDPKIEGFCLQLKIECQRVVNDFDWERIAQKASAILEQMLDRPRVDQLELTFWQTRAWENWCLLEKALETATDASFSTRHSH